MRLRIARETAGGLVALAFCLAGSVPAQGEAVPVSIRKIEGGYRMYCGKQPYFIKGASGRAYMDELVLAGGNTVRTWSGRHLERLLTRAEGLGLKVCVGLWMGQPRHGFDYHDRQAVDRQARKMEFFVRKYKDQPAVLMWGVGNEVEWGRPDDPAVYRAINDAARRIKMIDPRHPTMITLADIGTNGEKVAFVKRYCPDIDIMGVNTFGGLRTLPERLRKAGWERPYVVTEFGPPGPWEVTKTSWGAEIEMSSTAKAGYYLESYRRGILSQTNWCLGSFVFLWGHKTECTPTWFGMFLPHGLKLGAVDSMTYAWRGEWPENRCPQISFLRWNERRRVYSPGEKMIARLRVSDPEHDPLQCRWELMEEIKHRTKDGGVSTRMQRMTSAAISGYCDRAELKAPRRPGMYRLFVYIEDGQGGAACANLPFLVR